MDTHSINKSIATFRADIAPVLSHLDSPNVVPTCVYRVNPAAEDAEDVCEIQFNAIVASCAAAQEEAMAIQASGG